jgi:hypothetical protein
MDGLIRRQESKCVAADITEYAGVRILLQHLVQSSVYIAVTATLTQCRWTWCYILAWSIALAALKA